MLLRTVPGPPTSSWFSSWLKGIDFELDEIILLGR